MGHDDDEHVELAISGFRNAVKLYCRKKTTALTSIPQEIQDLLDHAAHCVRQLTSKRQSLENGLTYLQNTLWPKILLKQLQENSSSAHDTELLLQHFLHQCLRLHDGVMLLVSGECRHPGDISNAKKQPHKFQSKLAKQTRDDGYTLLFKAPGGYSGFGWDELFDAKVGIKTRLLCGLAIISKKKSMDEDSIWDYLMRHGGEALETLLDQLELSQLDHVLKKNLKQQVINDLKKLTKETPSKKATAVSFELRDKTEELCDGKTTVQRRGDLFQVSDPKGVLPNGLSAQDWSRIMKPPELQTKKALQADSKSTRNSKSSRESKRRFIVEDSSDEEDSVPHPSNRLHKQHQSAYSPQTPIAKSSESGLNIKVARKENTPQTPAQETSLAEIKKQMGADGVALEAAREAVEKEEAIASKAAKADEAEAMETTIEEGEDNIRRKRKKVNGLLKRTEKMYIQEAWDECLGLRDLLITVGNQILHGCTTYDNKQQRINALLRAHKHFKEAKTVVDDQDKLLRRSRVHGEVSALEGCLWSRDLLLMLGRASVNMGITSIDLATQTKGKAHYNTVEAKQYLRTAAEELKEAKEYAGLLRSRASTDSRNWKSDRLETARDAIRADALEALIMRSMGKVLWYQGTRNEAWNICKTGAALFESAARTYHDAGASDQAVHSELCNLATECVLTCTVVADLAESCWQHFTPSATVEGGDRHLFFFRESLTKACDVIDSIEQFFISNPSEEFTFEEFMEEEAIPGKRAIQQEIKEIEEWWEKRRVLTNPHMVVNSSVPDIPIPRSELGSVGLDKPATKWFTVNEGSRRQKKKRRGGNSMYHKNSGQLLSAVTVRDGQDIFSQSSGIQSQKYRPWGDELLPQIIDEATGQSVPKIEYPCVAPSMPPEIRAMLDSA
jgi:hypothetical protein